MTCFPLHVWMTGSGTQFNMNVNEVISNRWLPACRERRSAARGPVHPNDHVKHVAIVETTAFPSAMYIAGRAERDGTVSFRR